jgi:hypothetical protein
MRTSEIDERDADGGGVEDGAKPVVALGGGRDAWRDKVHGSGLMSRPRALSFVAQRAIINE